MKISEYVKNKLYDSKLNEYMYSKQINISLSKLKRYLSGMDDAPSPLVAYNFCKTFNLTSKEFAKIFDIKDRKQFIKAMDSYDYYKNNSYDIYKNIAEIYKLSVYSKNPKIDNPDLSFPCDVIFKSQENKMIASFNCKYTKIHKKQNVLEAYKEAIHIIDKAVIYKTIVINSNVKTEINNFIITTSSKNLFMELKHVKNQINPQIINAINLSVVLLPKYNSSKYCSFALLGDNILKESC